ncbi:MAG TPA: tRNA guanosine(34) transglycosylase Tgt [archaeon]|nr:tRNA guanosine(34) transglycosylase Tgt [archaeon]
MFKINSSSNESLAREGQLKTKKGKIRTPFFMPVATKGEVKFITKKELHELKYEAFIANAFILFLRPGLEVIEKSHGLHKMIDWNKPLFTDSGGFQMLSKHFLISSNKSGVHFRSPFDGQKFFMTPKKIMEIQNKLDSDVAMVLDDVPRFGGTKEYYINSLKRTMEFAKICKESHENKKQLLFGIAQGGTFTDLREKAIEETIKLGFDGIALGGLAIGEGSHLMIDITQHCSKLLPENQIHYLMGLGSPADLVKAVDLGMDCFDSIFPTRMARHGHLFTKKGAIYVKKAKYRNDFNAADDCSCYSCKTHSRAYLHHLFKTKEPNYKRFATYHNLHFISNLFQEMRTAIKENSFKKFKEDFLKNYKVKAS